MPAVLGPALRTALLRMSRREEAKDAVKRALGVLGNFIRTMKVRFQDIEVGLDASSETGVADSGDLESDLVDLLSSVAETAALHKTAVILFIDELQYIPEPQLAALIMALHRASSRQLPLTMIAAGLPQILGQTGRSKSYAERLFEFIPVDPLPVDPLDREDARKALCLPAEQKGVSFEESAILEVLEATGGYSYFIQEWGKHAWNESKNSPITREDARHVGQVAIAELATSFFRVRFDRLPPSEKKYMRAMAELGQGPHRSGDIAEVLEKPISAVAPIRARLIQKGMIYSPSHGGTAFTVPLFDGFMKRTIPMFVP